MNPVHHPDEEDLLGYASGTSPEWISLVVACHLTYCPECRSEAALLDDLGGVLLDSVDTSPASPLGVSANELRALPEPREVVLPAMTVPGLPRPLAPYLPREGTAWRFLAPGLRHIPLDFSVGGVPARVIRFAPGFTIPEHRHQGLEMVLVLNGRLSDSVTGEDFRKGDLSRREVDTVHAQAIGRDEPCTCLVVTAAPVVPSTLRGRILKAITGV